MSKTDRDRRGGGWSDGAMFGRVYRGGGWRAPPGHGIYLGFRPLIRRMT